MNDNTQDLSMNSEGAGSSSPLESGADTLEGYDSQLDLLAATLYNVRSQSSREMTPERWARIKRMFPSSARIVMKDAKEELHASESMI